MTTTFETKLSAGFDKLLSVMGDESGITYTDTSGTATAVSDVVCQAMPGDIEQGDLRRESRTRAQFTWRTSVVVPELDGYVEWGGATYTIDEIAANDGLVSVLASTTEITETARDGYRRTTGRSSAGYRRGA